MATWHTAQVITGAGADTLLSLVKTLREHGIAEWIVAESKRKEARHLLLELMGTPIDCGLLIGYARVEHVRSRVETDDIEYVSFTLSLPESERNT